MKITVNIECTPQEARSFMGLPDLEPLHAGYLDRLKINMDDGATPESLQALVKNWAPMGEAGVLLWRQLAEQIGKAAKAK